MLDTAPPAPERAPYIPPTISASRLKSIGGEKGVPGCDRKLAGAYLFGMKQAGSYALEFGTAVHGAAEVFQATGEIPEPEGEAARVLSAGAHLLTTCGPMLVEYEHIGTLPDGSPYVAYIDGHSADGGPVGTIVIQDIKTTSSARFALTEGDEPEQDPYHIERDLQAMFYSWILLCDTHWFCPPLPSDEHAGPKHWQWWDPAARGAKSGRLRWVYFLTKGVANAWEVNGFTTPASSAAFMAAHILPLVSKINALHQWHYAKPHGTIDEVEPNSRACDGRGRWCGVYEHDACNFDQLGTPALDLVQLKVRKMTTPAERIAALRAKNGAAPVAPVAPVATTPETTPAAPPPVAAEPAEPAAPPPVAAEPATPPPVAAEPATPPPVAAEPELTRGQKAAITRQQSRAEALARVKTAAAEKLATEGAVAINPPAEEAPAPAAPATAAPAPSADNPAKRLADAQRINALINLDGGASAPTTCPSSGDLLWLLHSLVSVCPVGVTITITGQR